jgi:glycosyltransferase involved in cell wall biosynthesis
MKIDIAEKLKYLIDNKEDIRNQIGRAARKKSEQYTWERTAKAMLEVLEETSKVKK